MKVLIGAPDRDFLSSYQKVFELEGHDSSVAFDGVQVMTMLREKKFEFIILDRSIPRVSHEQLVKVINEMGVPLIVLQTMRMKANMLLRENLANAYVRYPFQTEELLKEMEEIRLEIQNGRILQIGDSKLDSGKFLLEDKQRLTKEEIDILRFLSETQSETLLETDGDADQHVIGEGVPGKMELPVKHGLYYVNALNQKFERLRKKVRIQYEMNQGYGLVNAYE